MMTCGRHSGRRRRRPLLLTEVTKSRGGPGGPPGIVRTPEGVLSLEERRNPYQDCAGPQHVTAGDRRPLLPVPASWRAQQVAGSR